MKKYYTADEIAEGVGDLPPIPKITLQNLRAARKLQYLKCGGKCLYKIEWIEDYLRKNTVEPITA